jgi:hypothetical protein
MADNASGPVTRSMDTLVSWLSTVDSTVRFGPPDDAAADSSRLCAWPIDLLREQEVRSSAGPRQLRLRVRYLVTAEGSGEQVARLLDPVVSAAVDPIGVTVTFEAVPAELWSALGTRPRLALLVDVPVLLDRPATAAPLVTGPLRLETAVARTVRGTVLGPGDIPLPGMRVEAPAVGAGTYTDTAGVFRFGGLPPGELRLVLVGRGRYFHTDVTPATGEPVVIRCDFEEA